MKRIYRSRGRKASNPVHDGYSLKEPPENALYVAILHQAFLDIQLDTSAFESQYRPLVNKVFEAVGEYTRFEQHVMEQRNSFLERRREKKAEYKNNKHFQAIELELTPKAERAAKRLEYQRANAELRRVSKEEWGLFKQTYRLYQVQSKKLHKAAKQANKALHSVTTANSSVYHQFIQDRHDKHEAEHWFRSANPDSNKEWFTQVCLAAGRNPHDVKNRALAIMGAA